MEYRPEGKLRRSKSEILADFAECKALGLPMIYGSRIHDPKLKAGDIVIYPRVITVRVVRRVTKRENAAWLKKLGLAASYWHVRWYEIERVK